MAEGEKFRGREVIWRSGEFGAFRRVSCTDGRMTLPERSLEIHEH